MEYTKGEWDVDPSNNGYVIGNGSNWIARLFHSKAGFGVNSLAPPDKEVKANANLMAAAPIGDKLAQSVLLLSATLKAGGGKDNMLEVREIYYLHIKQLARDFKAKAEGK